MRARALTTVILAAALAAPLCALPGTASASCADRRVAGTVLGGVGGALIGGALGHGTGALIGGLGGAVIGHSVASEGCHRYRRAYRVSEPGYPAPPPPPAQAFYYDQYGQVAPIGAGAGYQAQAAPGVCRTEVRNYYDARGALRPVQVCVR